MGNASLDSAEDLANSTKIRPQHMVNGNRDHRRLLAAVRSRDAEAAAKMELEHLESTTRAIEVTSALAC